MRTQKTALKMLGCAAAIIAVAAIFYMKRPNDEGIIRMADQQPKTGIVMKPKEEEKQLQTSRDIGEGRIGLPGPIRSADQTKINVSPGHAEKEPLLSESEINGGREILELEILATELYGKIAKDLLYGNMGDATTMIIDRVARSTLHYNY